MPFKDRLIPGRRPDQTREVFRNTPNKQYVIKYVLATNSAGTERIKEIYAAAVFQGGGKSWVKIRKNATYKSIARAIEENQKWHYAPRSRRVIQPKLKAVK